MVQFIKNSPRIGYSNSEELCESVKTLTTEELHLNLPLPPRANRTRVCAIKSDHVTDEQFKDFYTSLYKPVMEAAAKALIARYSRSDLYSRVDTTTNEDITTLEEFYNGDIVLVNLWLGEITFLDASKCVKMQTFRLLEKHLLRKRKTFTEDICHE